METIHLCLDYDVDIPTLFPAKEKFSFSWMISLFVNIQVFLFFKILFERILYQWFKFLFAF